MENNFYDQVFNSIIKRLSKDVNRLSTLLNYYGFRDNISSHLNEEVEDLTDRITKDGEELNDLIEKISWDSKSNKWFQKLNAILLILPTVLGLTILLYNFPVNLSNKDVSEKIINPADSVTIRLAEKDSLINLLNARLTDTESKLSEKENKIADQAKVIDRLKSQLENANKLYYKYGISGISESIDLRKKDVEFLILENITNSNLFLQVNSPKGIDLDIELKPSSIHNSNLVSKGVFIEKHSYQFISIRRLRALNSNLELLSTRKNDEGNFQGNTGKITILVK